MTVMWSTRAPLTTSVVSVRAPTAFNASGDSFPFSDSNNVQMMHRVHLSGLAPATAYTYTVGSAGGASSAPFTFSTQPAPGAAWQPTLAIFGDMGISANAQATMPLLLADAASGAIDAVVHVGDAAYDLQTNNGAVGDAFMQQIQPLAANVPYHICPGNHEDSHDFYQYRMRLGAAMPPAVGAPSGGGNGTFHSFNVGKMHVIMVSSEVYFSVQPHSAGLAIEQALWLESDLKAVDRAVTPFVVLGLHQPFYCSPNDDSDDCHQIASLVRIGLEKIIYEGGVDVVFQAHEHAYERNYPVYQFSWNASRTGAAAYVNYDRPIHILTGAAGCPENQDGWQKAANPFSALRVNDYGYSRLQAVNATTLRLQYVDNVHGKVLDDVYIVKDAPGAAFPPAAPASATAAAPCAPEQLFLNYAESPTQMRVSWATACAATAQVAFGKDASSLQTVTGPAPARYTAPLYTSPYIYHVTLSGLTPGAQYVYQVGDASSGVSALRAFRAHPGVGADIPTTVAVIGDPGQTNNSASTYAHVSASASDYAMIVGDLSYADSDQPRWDSWQNLIQGMSATLPTLTQVGNHEIELTGFTAYAARMAMPAPASGPDNTWYSIDVGSVHWVTLSNYHAFSAGSPQYTWLKADLAAIDRSKTPWLFVNTHAPWYNTNTAHQGDGEAQRQALEALLYGAGADACFMGHVHAYERSHRAFNKARDPKGPVFINVGDGGNREGLYNKWLPPTPVTAFHAATYGHGEVQVFNATHAQWTWHTNPDAESQTEDSVWIIKGQDA